MKQPAWEGVKELFDEALRLPSQQRDSFLESQPVEPAILSEVKSLLAVYEEAPDFLEGHPELPPDLWSVVPAEHRRIGPWVLVRQIGQGGMGVVWEAQRGDKEYEQRVAIKFLQGGGLSSSQVARFREERQILARLNHPGIARLLDGGTAPDGSPFLVMEYVEGHRLDEWLDSRSLPLREIFKVFLLVAAAVDYAHRHLVIHRDLKPANILVTPEGTPKLLDFGIATLLDASSETGQAITGTALRLTPAYASPEQVRGEMASTGSDIYSLGMLLYRMITGQHPFAAELRDPLETMRAICEHDPPPPSAVAAASAAKLRGELDAIVLQALRKNPEERYHSVRAMADDVTAWMEGRPVAAHNPPWWRRALKRMQRNKTQTAAAAIVAASILAGSGISLWYARQAQNARARAEIRFNQVRRLAHSVIFELHDAISDVAGATGARRILVARALQYLQDLQTTGPKNREVDIEVAGAYTRIGEVLGNLGRAHLGDTAEAVKSETEARRLALELIRANPEDLDAHRILAEADDHLERLGVWQGDLRMLPELHREAEAIHTQEAARHPEDRNLAAKALESKADGLAMAREWSAALPAYQGAVADYLAAIDQNQRDPAIRARLVNAYHDLAACWKELGNLPAALDCYRKAEFVDRERTAETPVSVRAQVDLSFDLVEAGWIEYRLGRYRRAISDYEQSLAIQNRLTAADPQDIWMKVEAAKLLNTAAPAYEAAGDRNRAIQVLHSAAATLEAAMSHDAGNEDTRLHVGWVWLNLGNTYTRAALHGREGQSRAAWRHAEACYQRAIRTLCQIQFAGRPDLGLHPAGMIADATRRLADCRRHL
ncbi:MAG TPA: serine/threonine-protein kinase [Bryobacteraceae bacterium]|nr:serine/threonine-protein kinase [Bryobacteraceae bacterium]